MGECIVSIFITKYTKNNVGDHPLFPLVYAPDASFVIAILAFCVASCEFSVEQFAIQYEQSFSTCSLSILYCIIHDPLTNVSYFVVEYKFF